MEKDAQICGIVRKFAPKFELIQTYEKNKDHMYAAVGSSDCDFMPEVERQPNDDLQ
jgi:hypothetical protein